MKNGGIIEETLADKLLDPPAARTRSPAQLIVASILFVSAIVGLMLYFGLHGELVRLLRWVDAQGAWAAIWFIGLMAIVVVCLLPGIFFTTGAGFVFGLLEGSLYVVIGTTLGAAAAFLIARYLLGRRAARYIRERGRLRVVNEEMARHGWKVVLLTRLIPFFPGKLSNYFFGLAGFSFRGYVLGSLIGFIPFSVHNVYLGAIAADLAVAAQGGLGRSPVQWILYVAGFAAAVAAVWYCNRLARRALDRYGVEKREEVP